MKKKLQRLKDTLWYEQYEHQQSQFGMFNRGWWFPFSIMCAVWSASPWLCLTVLLASKACPCIPCVFCARDVKESQPPASILDIGQVTYAKSHSDWMIEGPFALAAARFVPACGFAKPAGRFLCLGFSYTTRADCWRSVIIGNEGETRCVHMSIKENHAWIHEQIGPPQSFALFTCRVFRSGLKWKLDKDCNVHCCRLGCGSMWCRRVVAGNIYMDHKSRFGFCVPNDRLIDGALQITEHVWRDDFTDVLTMFIDTYDSFPPKYSLAKVETLLPPTMPSEIC